MTHVRWAVVGSSAFALDWIAGTLGQASNARLAAVVSRSEAQAQWAAQRCGAALSYTNIDQIDRDQVDGVFLVVPNEHHAPLAIAAAQRGLHVVVEKPMAPTLVACQTMIAAAAQAGVTLAVAHCMEYSPSLQKARELLEAGAIGSPISIAISASWDSPPNGTWRQQISTEAGGGPLHDMGVHSIDAAQRLLGPIVAVSAALSQRVHPYVAEDSATLLVRFASGAHGTIEAHFNCNQNSLAVQGSGGRLWSSEWLGRDFCGDLTVEHDDTTMSFRLPRRNVYVPQIEHISAAILNGAPLELSAERGMANMAVIEAAIRSAREGRWVEV